MSVLRTADGRIRAGWGLAAFLATAAVVTLAASLLVPPQAATSLADPALAWSWVAPGLGAACATVVGQQLGLGAGLDRHRALSRFGVGLLQGLALISASVGGSVAAGALHLSPTDAPATRVLLELVRGVLVLTPAAFGEELLTRGVLLWSVVRLTGSPVVAAGATGALFGVLHLGNPDASPVAALNVALVGLWLGLLVIRTGSLWMATGAHVAWNVGEGFIFGQPVSGLVPTTSVLETTAAAGQGFFAGGAFGPEASGWTGVLTALAVVLTRVAPKSLDSSGSGSK